jgi:hypothetical protein
MPAVLRDRLFVAWALLVGATLVSAAIGAFVPPAGIDRRAAVTAAVLAIAFVKAGVVMFTYMDVRGAPLALRGLCAAWLAIVYAGLLAAYAGVLS